MQDIILESASKDALIFNLADLQESLKSLTDQRDSRGKIYPLEMILSLVVLAKLSGHDKPSAISGWIRDRKDQIVSLFGCRHHRIPCLNTIRSVLNQVDEQELQTIFIDYIHRTYGGISSRQILFDGKTMRGTIPKGKTQGEHLMALYLPEEGVVLKQIAVDAKQNEISAVSRLLEGVSLKNRVVCADAMHTQRDLSADIVQRGGDYVWIVKDNQATLKADIEQFFKPPRVSAGWHPPQLPQTCCEDVTVGHGRVEKRTITMMDDSDGFLDWPSAEQVFRLERTIRHMRTGTVSTETVVGLTSCSKAEASASDLLNLTRGYWAIENGLHYRRDVTLKEDATRFSYSRMARVMATMNNFLVGLVAKLQMPNLAQARRSFDAQIARILFGHSDDY